MIRAILLASIAVLHPGVVSVAVLHPGAAIPSVALLHPDAEGGVRSAEGVSGFAGAVPTEVRAVEQATASGGPAPAGSSASTATATVSPAPTSAATTAPPPPSDQCDHRLFLSFGSGAQAYLSDTRTMGGVGFSFGARDVFRDRFLFEADASYLFMVGNVFSVRAAGGVQLPGFWAPSATLGLTVLMGDRFSFIQPDRPLPLSGPTLKLDLVLSPLRFRTPLGIVSALQLGGGIGTEFSLAGASIHLGLLELAVPLP